MGARAPTWSASPPGPRRRKSWCGRHRCALAGSRRSRYRRCRASTSKSSSAFRSSCSTSPPSQPDRKGRKSWAFPCCRNCAVGSYVVRQHLAGRKRYPLVLMLEPLFRCNLACAGCGKIDYPDEILNQRMSVEDALAAVDECGAPVVSIAGGEPLLHKELPEIVARHHRAQEIRLSVHQCAADGKAHRRLCAEPLFRLVGASRRRPGDARRARCARTASTTRRWRRSQDAKARGFRVNINCTLFNNADPERVAQFFDTVEALGVDGITVSPGYAYERAPDQQHFLNRDKTKQLFRGIFKRGRGGRNWSFNQSGLFLDFLAGNQSYHCTPWGNPTRTIFGWQKPCYLLGEGYARNVQRADGRDRLGFLRHRQLREVRRLHGALRLRGDRGQRRGAPSVEGACRGAARRAQRGRDRARHRARGRPAGGISVQG